MSKLSKDTLDAVFADFDLHNNEYLDVKEPVTFWLPLDYKAKYDLIQERSKKRFGKLLKKVLMKSIDKIRLEDEAS